MSSEVGYVFKDYDYILIVSSWGLPSDYKKAKYALEVEKKVERREERRDVIKRDKIYFSSTSAIRDILWSEIRLPRDKIGLLIFVQDTILMDHVKYNRDRYFKMDGEVSKKRVELRDELLSTLYESNRDVAKELSVRSYKDYDAIVRFVPGVITSVDGAYLYTWRSERCYDLLVGSIILHTYKELKEKVPNGAWRCAILLDTTHGINYFVTALREGVLKTAVLYAFDRLIEGISGNAKDGLKEITIYHYNSDPVTQPVKGAPSLKIHLLNKTAIMKDGKVLLNNMFSYIEEQVLRDGLERAEKKLQRMWSGVRWRRVVEALLLLSRGLLAWTLRVVQDVNNLPTVEDFKRSLDELELKFSRRDDRYTIDYVLSDRKPASQVVEYSIITNLLRNLLQETTCSRDEVFKTIDNMLQGLKEELSNVRLTNLVKVRSEYICFNIEKLEKVFEQVYTSPYSDIFENEISNLKDIMLKRREVKWNKINEHVYVEPRSGQAYLIDCDDSCLIISKPTTEAVSKRVIYAHAGPAYGLPWFAISLNKGKTVLCLGKPDKILHILYTT